MIGAGVLLLLLAGAVWWMARWQQRRTGLPYARVRYDDASLGEQLERPLLSHRYRLTGRPDYLLERRGRLIPVEVKPTRQAPAPYESDMMQLVAYCLLVEEHFGQSPPYGLLRYASGSWEIPFTAATRQSLLDTLALMDEAEGRAEVDRSHQQPARCASCGQRPNCRQSLVGD